jgi:hypothetical protein
MFATYYRDHSPEKLKRFGNPRGDGRNAWAGELKLELENGKILYIDVSVKGVPTPLARKALLDTQGNILNRQYSDGLQSMEEAVHSFLSSNALNNNGLNAVQDLAVIELPIEKVNPVTGLREKAAITVRVGNQTRTGHLWNFAEAKANFRKIFDYATRRALGLPLDAPLPRERSARYLRSFAKNLARQAALYADMDFAHGSLTAGNQTTNGLPADFGTFTSFDAFHGEYVYLYDQLELRNQTDDFSNYIRNLLGYMQAAGYPPVMRQDKLIDEFRNTFRRETTAYRLQRLGLSEDEIGKMPDELTNRFVAASEALRAAIGKELRETYAGKIHPAAFSLREILKGALRVVQLPEAEQRKAWEQLLLPKATWSTLTAGDLFEGKTYAPKVENFLAAVKAVHGELIRQNADIHSTLLRAAKFGGNVRPEANFPAVDALMAAVTNPEADFRDTSRMAESIISALTDHPGGGTELDTVRFPGPAPEHFGCQKSFAAVKRPRFFDGLLRVFSPGAAPGP